MPVHLSNVKITVIYRAPLFTSNRCKQLHANLCHPLYLPGIEIFTDLAPSGFMYINHYNVDISSKYIACVHIFMNGIRNTNSIGEMNIRKD